MKIIQRYKKTFFMSAAALGMLAALTVESTMAYFTTYVSAGGSQVVNLEARTELDEDVSEMTKHIVLRNTSDRGDCFVRVRVFYGAEISVIMTDVEGNGDWYDGEDGYWYYRPILPVGGRTSQLDAFIDTTGLVKPGTDASAGIEYVKDKFNVIVVQECTPVLYDADGNPYADWDTVYTDYKGQDVQGEEAGN